ncbi:enoyl-CoA hydratase [Gordonia sp. LSe1-13]|uniref:Enoyl-CoA hydratase n=1 Tax=Gordonia sesuvii TaxID=3116777 RepID=A0ABU7MFK3_9ACTN|nr:enoyl-CoA hydratase [Gordonia sp. LSe1-13]MEE3851892.1 enoyl-CoA hydratase [Gordonia sp. LSe1-13]
MGVSIIVRKLFSALLAVVVGALTLLGVGAVSAEPQLPRIALYSDNFGTVGNHAGCRGAMHVGVVAPKGTRGKIRITVTSHGFTGDGVGWRSNPRCRILLSFNEISPNHPLSRETFHSVSFGPRPGQKFVKEINSGSGPAGFGVATYVPDQPVRVPVPYGGVSFLTVVP